MARVSRAEMEALEAMQLVYERCGLGRTDPGPSLDQQPTLANHGICGEPAGGLFGGRASGLA